MKLDLHVHTHYSGNTTIYPLNLFLKESYNSPEGAEAGADLHLVKRPATRVPEAA